MASEAPSWADQWGAGGIGAMEDVNSENKKNDKKNTGKGGVARFKAVAASGTLKFKNGILWVKNKFQKKGPSK